jgi:hypothetical protein
MITNNSTYKEKRDSVMENLDTIRRHICEVSDAQSNAATPIGEDHWLIADLAYVAEQLDLLHCFLTGEG